jgi:hypothetical protein
MKTVIRFLVFLVIAVGAVNAHAANVTTSIEFRDFWVAQYFSQLGPQRGYQLNGNPTVYSGFDPQPISGSSVTWLSGVYQYYGWPVLDTYWNKFSFDGASSEIDAMGPGHLLKLGTITYSNNSNPERRSFITFSITTHSDDPLYDNHVFEGLIRLDVHAVLPQDPSGDYTLAEMEAEADWFTITDWFLQPLPNIGSVRVYDPVACPGYLDPLSCNIGSVDVYGYISSLHVAGFANPTGGAFLYPTADPIPVPQVPAPASLFLFLAGAGVASLRATRRRFPSRILVSEERAD